MAMVRDTAKITRSGRPLPDVSGSELAVNAWLVWEAAKNTVLRDKDPEQRSHEGVAGYVWHGTVTSVFRELWSGMLDSYTGDKSEVVKAKTELGRYLRDTLNMVCLDRGQQSPLAAAQGTNRLPTWWVRGEWNPAPPPVKDRVYKETYGERRLTPAEAGEDRMPAPVEVKHVTPAAMPAAKSFENRLPAPSPTWEERRALILDAAVAILREGGETAVTKGAVAGAAGVGESTLYQHFKNMDDLRDEANAVLQAEPKAFPCPKCERGFDSPQGLGSHLNTHLEGEFPCRKPGCPIVLNSKQGRSNHEVAHATHDKFLEAAVRLVVRRGDGIDSFSNAEVAAEAGMPYGETLYGHFDSKADLLEKARAVVLERGLTPGKPVPTPAPVTVSAPEPGPTVSTAAPVDESLTAFVRDKVFLVAAFAASVGAPLSFSAIRGLVNGVNVETRAAALQSLVDDGKLHVATQKDVKNRDVDVYLPTEPFDLTAHPAPTPAVAAATADPVAMIQELLADYGRLRQAATRDDGVVATERKARRAAEDEADGLKEQLEDLKGKMRSFASFLNGA